MYFWSWNSEHHDQTINPTENFEPMNLLQMSCVIKWAQKKFSLQPQKKEKRPFFSKKKIQIGISTSKFLSWEKKFSCQPQKCKLELYMSNGFQVLIYLSFLLFLKEVALKPTKQLLWCYCSVNNNLIKIFFTIFKITND